MTRPDPSASTVSKFDVWSYVHEQSAISSFILFRIHSAIQGCAEHALLCAEVRVHAFFLPTFNLTHSLYHNCSQSELDKWLEVLNRAIYGPRGGMFGNELRVQVRREVRVLSQYINYVIMHVSG